MDGIYLLIGKLVVCASLAMIAYVFICFVVITFYHFVVSAQINKKMAASLKG